MIIKLVVLFIYVGILFLIGVLASRKIKNLGDFYVGGKNIGYWAVAFSARATGESGWLLIGLTGMGALAGVSTFWVVLGEVLGVAVSWFFMAKPFKRLSDSYGSITIPDFLESHFKSKTSTLRALSAGILAVFVLIFISSQIDATGIAFESFLGFNYYWGAILGFCIVMAYIFIGGFVAVVWSDLFQGLLMFFGLIILPILAYFSLTSPEPILTQLHQIDPMLTNIWGTSTDNMVNAFSIFGFSMIGLGFLGSPQIYVRFMSVKDEAEIDKGKWVAIIFTILTDSAAVMIGIFARILFTSAGEDPENILGIGGSDTLHMLSEYLLSPLFVAIYIAIVLSAIMSTVDSLIVLASSAIARDYYQKILNPSISNEQLYKISRAITLALAVFALIIAMASAILAPDRQIFWVIIFGWSGIAAAFCPVMILSLFWKKYNEKGAMASMISGFLCVPFFKFYVHGLDGVGALFEKLDVLMPSFIIAMLVGYVVSMLTQK